MKLYTKLRHFVELSSEKHIYVFPDNYCAATQSPTNSEGEKLANTVKYYRSRIVGAL